MGSTVGEPGRVDRQREAIREALSLLSSATVGGALITIATRWRR